MVPNASGVFGANNNGGVGVAGSSGKGVGVKGNSDTGVAIDGFSGGGDGIVGATGSSAKNGIIGRVDATNPSPGGPVGNGIFGFSMVPNASGVFGANNNGGVGVSGNGKTGVFGFSQDFIGVSGISNTNTGIFGRGRIAGRFEGDVEVTGDVRLLDGHDCAEEFDVSSIDIIEPGTVMVMNQEGNLQESYQGYDKRVAGIVCGAGNYKPGIILGKGDPTRNRTSISLIGRTYCKVDANYSPIEVGDLLTTSATKGHAMKAADSSKAFGAVIGKALQPLIGQKGLIPVLVALQ